MQGICAMRSVLLFSKLFSFLYLYRNSPRYYLYSSFSWLTRFQMVYVYRKAGFFFLAGHKLGGFKLNKVYHLEGFDSLT